MPLKYAICCQFRKLPPSPKLKQLRRWWFRRCPVFCNTVPWTRLISQGHSGQMTKVTWGPTKGHLEMPSVLMAGKCGADFTCEWGLGELPRSFLRAPVILFLSAPMDCLSLWEVSVLVFQKPKEKKKKDLQKQVPCCPFAHAWGERGVRNS